MSLATTPERPGEERPGPGTPLPPPRAPLALRDHPGLPSASTVSPELLEGVRRVVEETHHARAVDVLALPTLVSPDAPEGERSHRLVFTVENEWGPVTATGVVEARFLESEALGRAKEYAAVTAYEDGEHLTLDTLRAGYEALARGPLAGPVATSYSEAKRRVVSTLIGETGPYDSVPSWVYRLASFVAGNHARAGDGAAVVSLLTSLADDVPLDWAVRRAEGGAS